RPRPRRGRGVRRADRGLAQAPTSPSSQTPASTTWAQHVSPNAHGSHTGSTLAEAVADNGAEGTLVNHSENRLKLADIDGSVRAAERADLETIVCANNPAQVAPPPRSVPTRSRRAPGTHRRRRPRLDGRPRIVEDAVAAAEAVDPTVDVFCGAGVSTGEDVTAAGDLGAAGVLLASGVAKADDPEAVLEDLVSGI
ncbi:triose-phosphate isomerase, partial [Halorubrum saccharovorum]|uniref:triose-phosphate isomerase n=1 Tax=Halorubrum saccharovorum TaxID=2248 RepID=UPI0009B59BCA